MSIKKAAWVGAVCALVLASAREAGASEIRMDVLRQSQWQPYLWFTPGTEVGAGWSVKAYDDSTSGTLRNEWRSGHTFVHGVAFGTFEELRAKSFRVEYKPNASAETSVYRLTLDAPGWSSAMLPAPLATLNGPRTAGQPLEVSWPVYEGSGSAYVRVTRDTPPGGTLYQKVVEYGSGGMVTDPLPAGFGTVGVDYVRDLTGAATRMELLSGPATDMKLTNEVDYLSWQSRPFVVTPEPAALTWVTVGGVLLLGRRRGGSGYCLQRRAIPRTSAGSLKPQ